MSAAPSLLQARLAGLHGAQDREARAGLLLEALGDRSDQVREAAVALAAREIAPERLLPLVANGRDALVRNAALAALERQGPYARSAVELAVASPDPDLAMFACQVLGSIGGASSAPALLQALGHPGVNVVQAAAEALGRLRRPEAVTPLLRLLEREPWLQLAALDALAAIADPRAAPAILPLVADALVADPALEALARLASPVALPTLLPLLGDAATRDQWPGMLRAVGATLERAGYQLEGDPCAALLEFGAAVDAGRGTTGFWHWLAERLGDEADGASLRAAGALVIAARIVSLYPLALRWGADPGAHPWVAEVARAHRVEFEGVLRALLVHPDADVRAATLRVLPPAHLGPDPLRRALADGAPAVRLAACDALAALPDPLASGRLTELLDRGTPAERTAAARALLQHPESVRAVLASRLEGQDEAAVAAIIEVLGDAHVPELEEPLVRLGSRVPASCRRTALRAVARIPGSRAEVLLLRALADRDHGVQVEALDLLVARGGDKVRTTLLVLLGVDDSLRYHVIRALARLGRQEAVGPLIALYPQAPLHERIEILSALGRLSGREAIPFLRKALADPQPEIRRATARVLALSAGPGELQLLAELAADADWVLRAEAARALGGLGEAAHPLLLELGRDLDLTVARTARASLAGT